MIFVKFYPNPADNFGRELKERLRSIIDSILLDLERNYDVLVERRFDGTRGSGQCYELENISFAALETYLLDLDAVYGIRQKNIEFNGSKVNNALIVKIM